MHLQLLGPIAGRLCSFLLVDILLELAFKTFEMRMLLSAYGVASDSFTLPLEIRSFNAAWDTFKFDFEFGERHVQSATLVGITSHVISAMLRWR